MYNLFNKFLSDSSALLLHTCVQLRQPYKLVETTQMFLQCNFVLRLCSYVSVYPIAQAYIVRYVADIVTEQDTAFLLQPIAI